MGWSWYGGAWHADDPATTNPPPARAGRQGEYFDDAAVAPPVLAGPPRLVYDTHGDKHFTGKDSQWANGRNSVNGMLEAEILRRLAALRTHAAAGTPGAGGFVGFYYTKNEGEYVGNLGYKKGPKTNYYTIQIEVNVQKNEINYHGYPDTNAYVGLGYTAMARGLAL
jgi:hypothetical protein